MREDCPLKDAPNITLTPHVAWAPLQTRQRLLEIVINNIKCFIDGAPVNVVN
jgi:glycerate dehydrogenase